MPELAWEMVWRAVKKGVMLFAPVGVGGCAVKINPPLLIQEEMLREGLAVLEEIAAEL
jgi:4-aminobutyrate aminotransferase-like enzyme